MISKLNNISIKGIQTVVPKNEIDLRKFEFNNFDLNKIISTTGIQKVRYADSKTTSSDLNTYAAKLLIDKLDIDKNEIDAIINVSQTPDYLMPQTSNIIQKNLDINENCICLDLNIGCPGYIYGLHQASMLIHTNSCKNVLLLAGDTNSKIINDKDKALKLVFGDAGSATIISSGNNDIFFNIYNDGQQFNKLIVKDGAFRNPINNYSHIETCDVEGNIRSPKDLYMDGFGIFNFVLKKVPKLIQEIMEISNLDENQIDYFLLHQANKFMIERLTKKMNISPIKVPIEIKNYGNTGPSSIPLLLSSMFEKNDIYKLNKKNKFCLAGFGVGLSWGSCITDFNETNFNETKVYE